MFMEYSWPYRNKDITITFSKGKFYIPVQVIFPKEAYGTVENVVQELSDVISQVSEKPEITKERPNRFIVKNNHVCYSVGEFQDDISGEKQRYEVLETRPTPSDEDSAKFNEGILDSLLKRIEERLAKK